MRLPICSRPAASKRKACIWGARHSVCANSGNGDCLAATSSIRQPRLAKALKTRCDMIIVRGIAIHGVCPHHLVPFRGLAHVAYLPGGRLHGFGRIARLVDAIGHRFTYQEWMTRDIADALHHHGQARGAACVIEAEQLCLLLGEDRRGDERVVTQAFSGEFESDAQLRNEFLRAIG